MLESRLQIEYAKEFAMLLRIITAMLLAAWVVLVLIGKGGFAHLLLLTAIAMTVIEGVATYRAKMVG